MTTTEKIATFGAWRHHHFSPLLKMKNSINFFRRHPRSLHRNELRQPLRGHLLGGQDGCQVRRVRSEGDKGSHIIAQTKTIPVTSKLLGRRCRRDSPLRLFLLTYPAARRAREKVARHKKASPSTPTSPSAAVASTNEGVPPRPGWGDQRRFPSSPRPNYHFLI